MVGFVRRHAFCSVSLSKEAGRGRKMNSAQDLAAIGKRTGDDDLECIFNVKKIDLFFKLLPRQIYI